MLVRIFIFGLAQTYVLSGIQRRLLQNTASAGLFCILMSALGRQRLTTGSYLEI